jgi:hypothetical protein
LNGFEDAEQGSGLVAEFGDDLVDVKFFVGIQSFSDGVTSGG